MDELSTPSSSNGPPKTPRAYGSACDTCRRRRIKCDGNQPCDRCTKSAVACTYGSVSGRASAVSYARHLEQKVAELQALLSQLPHTESREQERMITASQESARQQILDMLISPDDDYVYRVPQTSSNVFYGRFGGLNVLRTVLSAGVRRGSEMQVASPGRTLVQNLEITTLYPEKGIPARTHALLPPKKQVQELTAHALRTALICHDCLDLASFSWQLDRLYDSDPTDYDPDDKSFLTLVYALIALGRRYSATGNDEEVDVADGRVKFKGINYFRTSYEMLNMTESHSLDTIRAVICHVRYLSSMSMISKAYSHMCIGVATALRMGLHVSTTAMNTCFTPDELYQRRKVFATLHMMNVYLSSLLGMRNLLSGVDEERTLSLPDEDLSDRGQSFIARSPTTSLAETVLCQKLNNIVARIIDSRHHMNEGAPNTLSESYEEDFDNVAMREAEMEEWHDSLPALGEDPRDTRALRAQLTLRLWYSLAQIVLYRPFLHYLSRKNSDDRFNIRGYECASACVRASMQAIWIVETINSNGILHEAFWFYTYLLGFAASILSYFVTCSARTATVEESSASVYKAKKMLRLLAKHNLMAKRCLESLDMFLVAKV